MSQETRESVFKKIEKSMETPAVFYGSTGVMTALVIGLLVYWFGFYTG